jgi:hypothetical protein
MNHKPDPGISGVMASATGSVSSTYGSTAATAGMWKKTKRSRVHTATR